MSWRCYRKIKETKVNFKNREEEKFQSKNIGGIIVIISTNEKMLHIISICMK